MFQGNCHNSPRFVSLAEPNGLDLLCWDPVALTSRVAGIRHRRRQCKQMSSDQPPRQSCPGTYKSGLQPSNQLSVIFCACVALLGSRFSPRPPPPKRAELLTSWCHSEVGGGRARRTSLPSGWNLFWAGAGLVPGLKSPVCRLLR